MQFSIWCTEICSTLSLEDIKCLGSSYLVSRHIPYYTECPADTYNVRDPPRHSPYTVSRGYLQCPGYFSLVSRHSLPTLCPWRMLIMSGIILPGLSTQPLHCVRRILSPVPRHKAVDKGVLGGAEAPPKFSKVNRNNY